MTAWSCRRGYNVAAPTQPVTAIRLAPSSQQPEVVALRWGLIPRWATDPKIGSKFINARAETVADKPTFRAALQQRRCLILADGFYEWQPVGKRKQPFYFRRRDGQPFAIAGLWERWQDPGQTIDSCTLLTTAANGVVQPIHDRMPVLLDPAVLSAWLNPGTAYNNLLQPCPEEVLLAYPVDGRVNNARTNDPECMRALPGN